MRDAKIYTDRNLRLQYLAGLGLNLYRSDPIYEEMLAYRRFPEELFVGAGSLPGALRRSMEQKRTRGPQSR